jgi:hypothetical protein
MRFEPPSSGSPSPEPPPSEASSFETMPVAPSCNDLIAVLAGDDDLLGSSARIHVAHCLRCQAELANHRRLRRAMRALSEDPVPVDPTLEAQILLALDEHDARHARRVPSYAAATLGGLAAAAGMIALATRQRRGTRLAG